MLKSIIFSDKLGYFTCLRLRQSLLSLHMTKSYVRTATRTTCSQILNFKANFHTEFERFFKKKIMLTKLCYQHKNKKLVLSTEDLIISKNSSNIKVPKYCHAQVSLSETKTL